MFDELLPMTLDQGAKHLGVEPLEVVRLMVETDTVTSTLRVNADQLAALAAYGGVESGWWDGREVPDADDQAEALVRAALTILVERAGPDAKPVRMDNLWRGLPRPSQALLDEAFIALADDGALRVVNAPPGVQVLASSEQLAALGAIGGGAPLPAGLQGLLGG